MGVFRELVLGCFHWEGVGGSVDFILFYFYFLSVSISLGLWGLGWTVGMGDCDEHILGDVVHMCI